MSFSEEKKMILKMLEEGRINSEEAEKLLEALDSGRKQEIQGNQPGSTKQSKLTGHNYFDEVAKVRERINEWQRELSKNYNQQDFDKMVDEISAKVERFGKNVATAAFGIADKVVDFIGSIIDTRAFNIFGNCVLVEKTFEADAAPGSNLELKAVNGQITVKKHPDDKIIIKAKIRTPQPNAENCIVFSSENGTVSLKPAQPDTFNLSVSYDVFVPSVKFNKLTLETKNSKIYVEDTISEEFASITKNGAIDLTGVTSEKVAVNTKNGKIVANYLIGGDITLETKNSSIEIKNLKTANLSASTTNGKIVLENLLGYEDSDKIDLSLKTLNADIKANFNDSADMGYYVRAKTSNGGINLLIPNLLYKGVPKIDSAGRQVEAESSNYSAAAKKVNIYAETQNGYIEIIK